MALSFSCTVWAWKQPVDSPSKRLVLLALADIASDGGKVWASHAYVAEKTSLSPRTVRSMVQQLEDGGLLRAEPRAGKSDIIWLNLTALTLFADGPPDQGEDVRPRGRPKTPANEKTPANGGATPATDARTPAAVADEPIRTDQKGTEGANALVVGAAPVDPRNDIEKAFDAYNAKADIIPAWSKALKLNDVRKRALGARMKEVDGLQGWLAALESAQTSPFLTGNTRGRFELTLDFLLQPSSFVKLIEGFYHKERQNDGNDPSGPAAPGAAGHQRNAAMFAGIRAASDRR